MPAGRKTDAGELALVLTICVVILLLWGTFVVYPLQVLVVFFHELSHGLAAIATGGGLHSMQLTSDQGGLALTYGGWRFFILSAGYLGSLLWGGLILLAAARSRDDRVISQALGLIILLVGVAFVRPFVSFGLGFTLLAGAALIAAGKYLSEMFNDRLLKVIGVTSCLYVIADIKSDLLDRRIATSDAGQLAQMTGLPSWLWGALWFLIAVAGTIGFLWLATRAGSKHASNTATSK